MAKMARPSRELTFRLDGTRITVDDFKRAVDAFIVLIKEVAHEVTGKPKPIDWIVSVREGSIQLTATAEARGAAVDVSKVTAAIYDGLKALGLKKTGVTRKRPPYFSDLALYKAREIANVAGRTIQSAEILVRKKKTVVQRQTAINVEVILGLRPTDFGTIEGVLETISIRGRPHFAVRDLVMRKQVRCLITETKLFARAVPALGKRVAVTGMIRYRETGDPAHIAVRDIKTFLGQAELPSADDVYGILSREG